MLFLLSGVPSERSHFALVSYYAATSSSLPPQCLQMPAGRNVKAVKHHRGAEKLENGLEVSLKRPSDPE